METGTFSQCPSILCCDLLLVCLSTSGTLRSIRDALLPGEVALVFLLLARKVTTDTGHSNVGEFVWPPEPSHSG